MNSIKPYHERLKDKDSARDRSLILLNRYVNLAVNRFKWSGLPNGLTSVRLEEFLLNYGMVAFFRDGALGDFILPCFSDSRFNVYGYATDYTTLSMNGELNTRLDADDTVIIRNNALATADIEDIWSYVERINSVEKTIDINLFQLSIPFVFNMEEAERLTFKNFLKDLEEYKLAIFMKKGINLHERTEVFNTDVKYLLNDLQKFKIDTLNELLTFLGINNANTDKKERLIVDEVNANNDFILNNLEHMFDLREKAASEINEKFGTNITVEMREIKVNAEDLIERDGINE